MTRTHKIAVVTALCIVAVGSAVLFMLLQRPEANEVQSITGVVTGKYNDCGTGEEMDANGRIRKVDQVPCDVGSSIMIDRKHRFVHEFSSPLTQNDYSIDVSHIKVGDTVTVKYMLEDNDFMSLDCAECSIELAR